MRFASQRLVGADEPDTAGSHQYSLANGLDAAQPMGRANEGRTWG